jgi:hypothetical protein
MIAMRTFTTYPHHQCAALIAVNGLTSINADFREWRTFIVLISPDITGERLRAPQPVRRDSEMHMPFAVAVIAHRSVELAIIRLC